MQIYTIGHSSLSFEEFVSLLKEFGISLVADIRRYPSSRKFPHFNRPLLSELLAAEDIGYLWLEALGGRRHTGKSDESLNIGLKESRIPKLRGLYGNGRVPMGSSGAFVGR